MKYLSFRWRLFLTFILVIAIGISAVVLFISNNMNATVRTNEGREMSDRVERMKTELQQYYESNNSWDGVQATVEQIGRLNAIRVILVDNNVIIGDSENEYIGMEYDPESPPNLMPGEPAAEGPRPPFGVMFVSDIKSDKLSLDPMPFPQQPPRPASSGPAPPQPRDWEDLRQTQINELRDSINMAVLWAVLIGIGLAAVITFFWSRSLTKPIQSLAAAARNLAKGDLHQRVEIHTRDEVGELANDFNQMAADLERTDRLRKNMVADIAHEIRTPLSNLRGYIEGIQDDVIQVNAESKEYMYEEVMLLSRLVDDLHDLALVESGEMGLIFQTVDMRGIADSAVRALQPRVAEKNITLKLEMNDTPALISADRERIAQVLRNLIVNAINYTPEGGKITVSVENKESEIEVSVTDTGIGIPADEVPLVFERFYRVDKSRTRIKGKGGTGLGLTIASQIVKAHNGTINLQSELNKGSRFYFKLPSVIEDEPSVEQEVM